MTSAAPSQVAGGIEAQYVTLVDSSGVGTGGPAAPRHRSRGLLTTAVASVPIPANTKLAIVYCSTLARVGAGASASPAASVQEKQTITKGDATSGNFKATFQGQQSANIAWNTSAASFVTAMVALSSVGTGGVTGSGGTLDAAPVVLTFAAGILDGDQPLITLQNVDLAGGVDATSRMPTVGETTAAVTSAGYCEAGAVLKFPLASTDAYLYLTAESGTGVYRIGWFA